MIDMPMDHMDELNALAGRYYPGRVENHAMLFYGVCPDCLEMENLSLKEVDKSAVI